MLLNAMNAFQVAKRAHKENAKAQYTDKLGKDGGAKTYFRASELGSGDRKILYSFFAHNLPKKPKSAQNLRQLENGDFVHDRYQTAWEEMGALISMEERLSSKDDDYLKDFNWEWAGHYDGLLDVNILRAHAEGKLTLESFFNEETGAWELDVTIDEAFANELGMFDEEGNFSEEYLETRPTMVADIKTMNPWGFKALKDKADVSNIQGYIDQIMFYMYMLNTPYGSIYVEAKDNNDVVEVQILWTDLHYDEEDGDEAITYEWDENIHGAMENGKVRVRVNSEWFFGGDEREGAVPRLERIWGLKEAIVEADAAGDTEAMKQLFPIRCSDKPESFPCSWGHKNGNPQYCEFYDHCWNKKTQGAAIKPFEEVPAEFIWEFDDEGGTVIRVDSRKVPEGIDQDAFATLVSMGALVLEKFTIPDDSASEEEEPAEDRSFNEDKLFSTTGELNLMNPIALTDEGVPTEAVEYLTDRGQKAIDCLNCGKQVTYQKLAPGGMKKCTHCKHMNQVTREGVTA